MKRYRLVLFLGVLCAMLLCSCSKTDGQSEPSGSGSTSKSDVSISAPAQSSPQENQPDQSTPAQSEPEKIQPEARVPYTIPLEVATPVYSGPSYDWEYAQIVDQDGVYTIVEEAVDEEGNLWGRLKSGVGWVDLTYVRSDRAVNAPLTASFADKALLSGGNYHQFMAGDAEKGVQIAFRAREDLKDVSITSLDLEGKAERTLHTQDALTEEKPLVVQVLFYGDLTAYGISFTDSSGNARNFAVYISGRNGALVLQESTP